jgi:hypothetical protein
MQENFGDQIALFIRDENTGQYSATSNVTERFFERRFPETQLANAFEKSLKLGTVISLDLIDHAGQGGGLSAPEHAPDDAIVCGHAVRRVLRPA